MAPPANQVNRLMGELLQWLGECQEHPLILSSVFHYEFEFIHPFSDGNGRMGRLWQTLILSQWGTLSLQIFLLRASFIKINKRIMMLYKRVLTVLTLRHLSSLFCR